MSKNNLNNNNFQILEIMKKIHGMETKSIKFWKNSKKP